MTPEPQTRTWPKCYNNTVEDGVVHVLDQRLAGVGVDELNARHAAAEREQVE